MKQSMGNPLRINGRNSTRNRGVKSEPVHPDFKFYTCFNAYGVILILFCIHKPQLIYEKCFTIASVIDDFLVWGSLLKHGHLSSLICCHRFIYILSVEKLKFKKVKACKVISFINVNLVIYKCSDKGILVFHTEGK